MASANCWKCLLRPSSGLPVARLAAPTPIIAFTTAPFSTSAMLSAKGPPKKLAAKDSAKGHIRAGKRMRLGKFKKKKEVDRGKPPGPGERKAFRKRIQLSNNNALAVPDLQPLTKEAMADRQAAGAVLAVPDAAVDQLRTLDAFKPTQCWGLFRQPSVLLRSETVDLVQKMQQAAGNKEALRLVVTGDRISGKSMLMLQAMANGLLNDWVVINIPEAQELTTASTEYSPLSNSNPVQYLQPVYTFKLLQAIRNANEKVLSSLKTVNEHPNLQMHVPSGSSLFTLASAAREADQAWAVFQALWAELTEKDAGRPPVMVALDGLAHIMKVSDYRNAAFEPIHSHDLALVRMYVDLLTGATKLPNGGAVLAATSRGNSPTTASMELALARRQAAQQGKEVPPADPYFKGYDERVEAALSNVEVMGLQGVNKAEARSLMEYWAASGLLRAKVDEKAVTGTWSVSGNGVVGEMERAALLNMRL